MKPIRRYQRSLGSVEWPFAATRKAYASVFTSNLATEVLSTADCKSRPSKLSDTELRFHPTQEMRLGAMLGPQHPVAARTFHPGGEGGHQRALGDKLRK